MMHFASYICILLVLAAAASAAEPVSRKVTITLNPDCPADEPACRDADSRGSYNNLLYIKATDDKDALHILYSNINSFSILIARTKLTSQLSVNWTNLLSNEPATMYKSIEFSETPIETSAYAIPTFYEFDDEVGKADMTAIPNNASYWVLHKTADLVWNKFNLTSPADTIGTFEGSPAKGGNGTFKLVIKYKGKTVRDTDLPHMLFDSESSVVEFVVEGVEAAFKRSKFAVNVQFVANQQAKMTQADRRSLDDEYTPGTFKLWSVETTDEERSRVRSYFQWKPIFYYKRERSLESSTITRQYDLAVLDDSLPVGIVDAFYVNATAHVGSMNISFGLAGKDKDSFDYMSSNYSVFAFEFGFGAAPNEKMSFMVTLVIIIGFGLPAIVILVGLVVMGVNKIKNRKSATYEEL